MCPAAISACAPLPQNRSIRPGPVMALPVSWLNTNACRPPGGNLSLRIQHWLLYLDERQSAWREEALVRRLSNGQARGSGRDYPGGPVQPDERKCSADCGTGHASSPLGGHGNSDVSPGGTSRHAAGVLHPAGHVQCCSMDGHWTLRIVYTLYPAVWEAYLAGALRAKETIHGAA